MQYGARITRVCPASHSLAWDREQRAETAGGVLGALHRLFPDTDKQWRHMNFTQVSGCLQVVTSPVHDGWQVAAGC